MSSEPLPSLGQNRQGVRPHRSPPRNHEGEITCTHEDCKEDHLIFKRLCEYNKHMDKHERPYKCQNSTCRKNPGFTYAGGLLRHQREVHSMHRTKDPFFCPHSSCNRSAGSGFSRRENLEEHLRRRHSGAGTDDAAESVTTDSNLRPLQPLPLSRKRHAEDEAQEGDDSQTVRDQQRARIVALEEENQGLRMELFRQKQDIERLSRMVVPQPPLTRHAVYQLPPHG